MNDNHTANLAHYLAEREAAHDAYLAACDNLRDACLTAYTAGMRTVDIAAELGVSRFTAWELIRSAAAAAGTDLDRMPRQRTGKRRPKLTVVGE